MRALGMCAGDCHAAPSPAPGCRPSAQVLPTSSLALLADRSAHPPGGPPRPPSGRPPHPPSWPEAPATLCSIAPPTLLPTALVPVVFLSASPPSHAFSPARTGAGGSHSTTGRTTGRAAIRFGLVADTLEPDTRFHQRAVPAARGASPGAARQGPRVAAADAPTAPPPSSSSCRVAACPPRRRSTSRRSLPSPPPPAGTPASPPAPLPPAPPCPDRGVPPPPSPLPLSRRAVLTAVPLLAALIGGVPLAPSPPPRRRRPPPPLPAAPSLTRSGRAPPKPTPRRRRCAPTRSPAPLRPSPRRGGSWTGQGAPPTGKPRYEPQHAAAGATVREWGGAPGRGSRRWPAKPGRCRSSLHVRVAARARARDRWCGGTRPTTKRARPQPSWAVGSPAGPVRDRRGCPPPAIAPPWGRVALPTTRGRGVAARLAQRRAVAGAKPPAYGVRAHTERSCHDQPGGRVVASRRWLGAPPSRRRVGRANGPMRASGRVLRAPRVPRFASLAPPGVASAPACGATLGGPRARFFSWRPADRFRPAPAPAPQRARCGVPALCAAAPPVVPAQRSSARRGGATAAAAVWAGAWRRRLAPLSPRRGAPAG
ncbi:hypothetical protein BU14_0586s0005, partial [Porphyra umbilicalis]